MYEFVDQPVDSLSDEGRFLLWAMRGWAHAVERGQCPPRALCRGFASVRSLAALPDFHIALAMLGSDALGSIKLAPMNCIAIVEDEAVLLSLWRNISQGDHADARAMLTLLVDKGSVTSISVAMIAAAAKFADAGFDLAALSVPA